YSTAFSSQALFSEAFRGTDWLNCVAACPVDGAHYRELNQIGKGDFALNSNPWLNRSLITRNDD
ncbi:hypothetical protein ACW5WY_21290, partial [Aeromonas aquatica]